MAHAAYLSACQAAVRLGVSDKTVRTWVRSGRLRAAPTRQGFRIPVEAVETLAAERGATLGADTARKVAHAAAPPHLADQLADLRAYVADLRTQLEVKDRKIAELHTLLARAQRALPDSLRTDPGPSERERPWWRLW